MTLTPKQIKTIEKRYGKELSGEAHYWAYSSLGAKEDDLEQAGFKILDKAGFYKAKSKHTKDSDTLNYKFWKEGIVGGWLGVLDLLEPEADGIPVLTEKQLVNLMWEICKENHGKWPMTKREGGEDNVPIATAFIIIRLNSIQWFYDHRDPKIHIVCEYCESRSNK